MIVSHCQHVSQRTICHGVRLDAESVWLRRQLQGSLRALLCWFVVPMFGALLAALSAPLAAPLSAQVQVLEPPKVPSQDVIPDNTFLPLHGDFSAVGFLPGHLDRAHHFLRRLDLITGNFNKWSDVSVPVVAYLVDREQWHDMKMPGLFGIPIRTGPTAVVVPSAGDTETVRMWRSILGVDQLPLSSGVPLRGSADEATSLAVIDVLAQIEAARGFVQRAGLLGDAVWVGEVNAHLTARVLFMEHEPQKLAEIDFIFDQIYASYGGDRQHGHAEFRPDLVVGEVSEIEVWLWFQGAYARGARIAANQRGRKAIKAVLKQSRKAGGALTAAEMRRLFPGLDAWMANFR